MLLLILGAGASHDCSPLPDLSKPHLARELFDKRPINLAAMQHHPVVRPIISELEDIVENNSSSIETELDRLVQESETNNALKRQLMALRFYLREIIESVSNAALNNQGGVTSYVSLVNKLQKWQKLQKEPICIINFNYDLLLEEALLHAGINWKVSIFDDYTKRDDFILIKPHGSINWVRWVSNPTPNQIYDPIENAHRIDLEDAAFHMSSEGFPQRQFIPVPALAVPVGHKYSFECPQVMLGKMAQILPKTTKVITIGWQGAEEHFKAALETINNKVDLMIVTGSEEGGARVLSNLNYLRKNRVSKFSNGFTAFVKIPEFQQFLDLEHF